MRQQAEQLISNLSTKYKFDSRRNSDQLPINSNQLNQAKQYSTTRMSKENLIK
jgi:hypothetical protein